MLYIEYEEYKNRYYEVQRKYNAILNEKEELFSKTQPKATQITGDKTTGGVHINLFDDYLIQKERKNIDKRLEEVKSILEDRERLVKLKEQELRASTNSYDKIYRCRYVDRLTIEKTCRISNYSRSQVFNILKEIRDKLK
jgi:DNA gyrase/topoisomerase IV subunit A